MVCEDGEEVELNLVVARSKVSLLLSRSKLSLFDDLCRFLLLENGFLRSEDIGQFGSELKAQLIRGKAISHYSFTATQFTHV